jgi:hypothetical protein
MVLYWLGLGFNSQLLHCGDPRTPLRSGPLTTVIARQDSEIHFSPAGALGLDVGFFRLHRLVTWNNRLHLEPK